MDVRRRIYEIVQPDDGHSMLSRLFDRIFKLNRYLDADETQAIYEGVIDCLITLRERKN